MNQRDISACPCLWYLLLAQHTWIASQAKPWGHKFLHDQKAPLPLSPNNTERFPQANTYLTHYSDPHIKSIYGNMTQISHMFIIYWCMTLLIKSPRVTGGLIVFGPFPPPSPPPPPPPPAAVLPTLFNFRGKPLKLISPNHTRLTYGCGKFFWHPSRWPWSRSLSYRSRTQFSLSPR